MQAHEVILKPLLTEKTTAATEANNVYAFEVNKKANKYQIKNAIETYFDVKVSNVRTAIIAGKVKRAGRHIKKTSSWKKAYIKVQDGQKIELYKNI